jgi:O-antigen/teichoic acid export membrane protein
MIAAVWLLKSDSITRTIVAVLGIAALLKSLKALPIGMFQALERFELYAASQIMGNTLLFIGSLTSIFAGVSLIGFALVFVIIKCIDTLIAYMLIATKKIATIRFLMDYTFVKDLQLRAIPFGLFALVIEIYSYADTIMLSVMRGDTEVGLYSAAFKIYEGLCIFPLILCQAIFPQLARLYHSDKTAHLVLSRRAVRYAGIAGAAISILGFFASQKIIELLFGSEYLEASISLMIFTIAFTLTFLNYVVHNVLVSIDRQNFLLFLIGGGLAINIIGNLLLIPGLGHAGAALALAISALSISIIGYSYVRSVCGPLGVVSLVWRPVVVAVFLGVIYEVVGPNNSIVMGLVSIPLYIVTLAAIGTFEHEDLVLARKVIMFVRKSKITMH